MKRRSSEFQLFAGQIAVLSSLAACLGGLPPRASAEGLITVTFGHATVRDGSISVTGTGEVLARPTRAEIEISTGGSAELTADAGQKYRDALRRTTEAVAKLKMNDLTIEERELAFNDSAAGDNVVGRVAMGGRVVRGAAAPEAKPQVGISRSLRLVLGNIQRHDEAALMETIGTVIDTARDAGATIRKNSSNATMSLVTFVVDEVDKPREQAYQKAFDAAKSRATRLARLAGATLGRVYSINEQQNQVVSQRYTSALYLNSDGDARLISDTLCDIPVRVTLHVSFALMARDDPNSDDEEEDSE